jgi:exoribonuclease-2
VPIAANLRHDQLDAVVTEAGWTTPAFARQVQPKPADAARRSWHFCTAWRKHLKAQREVVRGKPETFNRPGLQLPARWA